MKINGIEVPNGAILWGLEEVYAEWLWEIHSPMVRHRYDVSMRIMRGQNTRAEMGALNEEQLVALLDAA